MPNPGEIMYEPEDDMDSNDHDNYCVIIGKDIPGGCQVEICDGLESCPYFKH